MNVRTETQNDSDSGTLAVIGAGCWGTTLASLQASNFARVNLFTPEVDVCEEIARFQTNSRYLDDFRLSRNVFATSSLERAVDDASVLIIAVPSHVTRGVARDLRGLFADRLSVVLATKGLEQNTGLLSLEVWRQENPPGGRHGSRDAMVLSGPNLAREICGGMPTVSLLAGSDAGAVKKMAERLSHPLLSLMPYHDPLGAQVSGALKNVYAVGCGIATGLRWGDNATAVLIWRGLAETSSFAHAVGGDPSVVTTPAGIGDFIATCSSPLSRNHDLGRMIAGRAGENEEARGVREGAQTAQEALRRSRALGLELKLLEAVWSVMAGAENPRVILQAACSATPPVMHADNRPLAKLAEQLPSFSFKPGMGVAPE
ncbi:MAG TPA: NAD(P)H-dependent glycerol-3-phosphate dehydrogenase [Candidatus Anoxymicrobiaceae bacterium]|jgi:glycerol-3-phosphate dehydrogenase (NAD(P)+)